LNKAEEHDHHTGHGHNAETSLNSKSHSRILPHGAVQSVCQWRGGPNTSPGL